MPTGSYQSGSSKRLFINYPFRKGMAFQNLISGEFSCKTLINYDYSNAGDYVYPRPAFVNALLHNGNNTITLPESTVVMTTNAGPKFLVSVQEYVEETVFANDEINASSEAITGTYGLHIHRILNDVTGFETSRGAKQVILDYVWDGDTIDVKDTIDGPVYRVRLLGVNTPEDGQPYYTEAKTFLTNYLAGKALYLVFEPASEISKTIDGTTRYYAYLFAGEVLAEEHTFLVNYLILRQGYGHLEFISDSYLFYDELREAYYAAIADEWRLHGTETDYTARNILEYQSTMSILNNSGYSLITDITPTSELYFKKDVYEITNIDTNFYDTLGFNAATLEPTDIFTPNATTKIQMEYNWYTKNEHGHTVQYLEFPHANHTWRNAMSFIGRIISDGEIVYKGLITLQYNPTEPFRIILIKPESAEPLTWNLEDPSSIVFNALNPTPFIFEDHVNDDISNAFRYPVISSTIIYDRDPLVDNKAKIISGFQKHSNFFIKPYLTIPYLDAENFDGVYIRFNLKEEDNRWYKIVRKPTTLTLTNSLLYEEVIGNLTFPAGPYPLPAPYTIEESLNHMSATSGFFYTGSSYNQYNGVYYRNTTGAGEYTLYAPSLQKDFVVILADGRSFVNTGTDWMSISDVVSVGDGLFYDSSFINNYNETLNIDFGKFVGRPITLDLKTVYIEKVLQGSVEADDINYASYRDPMSGNTVKINITAAASLKMPLDAQIGTNYRINVTPVLDTGGKSIVKITNLDYQTSIQQLVTYSDVTKGLSLEFEGLNFFVPTTIPEGKIAPAAVINNFEFELLYKNANYSSTSATQMIFLSSPRAIDQNDILGTHNVYNATHMTQLDRYLVLYGPHMGNHSLQFLEYDNFSLAPFPNGQITFDAEIVHVHSHRGNLYVFCKDGIWILHSGFTYAEMIKTFAYSGIALHPAEIGTIASLGNNVFVVHNNKGFMIRTNQNVDDQSDVYTIPITGGVDQIMEDPRPYIMERLHYGYSILTHPEDEVTVYYKSFVDNNEIHLTASYFLRDPLEKLFISYIYNNDTGRWKMYDTICGGYPLEMISSNNAKGFDYLLINDFNDGVVSIATYLHEIPVNSLYEYTLGDSLGLVRDTDYEWKPANITNGVTHPFIPISCEVDFGALDLQSMHKKVIRKFYVNIINVEGEQLTFKALPYIDGVATNDDAAVEALLNAVGELQETIDQNTEIIVPDYYNFISPAIAEIEGLAIPESFFTTQSRVILDIRTHLIGKIPGLKLLIPTTSRYHITHYAIIYRQLMAR